MLIPPLIAEKILQFVVKSAPAAFRGSTIVRKVDIKKIGGYVIKVIRRNTPGTDGGISQMVKVSKNNVKEAVWHIVVKAGKVIHQDPK